jgi:hypothetical protein
MKLVLWILFISCLILPAKNSLAEEPLKLTGSVEEDWKLTLNSFQDSLVLKNSLAIFIKHYQANNTALASMFFKKAVQLRTFLDSEEIQYSSMHDLEGILTLLVADETQSFKLQAHLFWINYLFSELTKVESLNSSFLKVTEEINRLLSLGEATSSKEALVAKVDQLVNGRIIERQKLELLLATDRNSPYYAERLYAFYKDGLLTDTLRRLMLSRFLNLRSLSTPILKRASLPQVKKATSGRTFRIEKVVDYENPESFVRDGQLIDDDYVNIAIGNLQRKRFYRQNLIPNSQAIKPRRVVVLLADISPSMYEDSRWKIRNDLIASYLDKAFSQALAKDEDLTVWMFTYAETVGKQKVYTNLQQVASDYDTLINLKDKGSDTNHTLAIEEALDSVISGHEVPPTHLNIVPITDGDGSIDLTRVQAKLNQFEKTRISFSTISLVKGDQSFVDLTEKLSATMNNVVNNDISHLHLDNTDLKNWVSDQWILQNLSSNLERGTQGLNVSPFALMSLIDALRKVTLGLSDLNFEQEIKKNKDSKDSKNNDNDNDNDNDKNKDKERDTKKEDDGNSKSSAKGKKGEKPEKPPTHPELDISEAHKPLNVDANSIEQANSMVAFVIKKLQGPRPTMLFYAQTHNLEDATQNRVAVTMSPAAEAELVIQAAIPTVVQSGMIPIVTPDGYRLVNLTIEKIDGSKVSEFQVFESISNGLYFATLDITKVNGLIRNGTSLRVVSHYKQDRRSLDIPEHFMTLNSAIIKNLAQDLELAGATELSGRLQKAVDSRQNLSAKDIETIFYSTGFYTFLPSTDIADQSTINNFSPFSQFLKNGIYYYQCSGANTLLSSFFERYFVEAGGPFRAETLSGFVVPKLGNLVTLGTAHRITSLSHKNKMLTYLRIDGTPNRFDKNSPRPLMMPNIPRFNQMVNISRSLWTKIQKLWEQRFSKEKPLCSSIL